MEYIFVFDRNTEFPASNDRFFDGYFDKIKFVEKPFNRKNSFFQGIWFVIWLFPGAVSRCVTNIFSDPLSFVIFHYCTELSMFFVCVCTFNAIQFPLDRILSRSHSLNLHRHTFTINDLMRSIIFSWNSNIWRASYILYRLSLPFSLFIRLCICFFFLFYSYHVFRYMDRSTLAVNPSIEIYIPWFTSMFTIRLHSGDWNATSVLWCSISE